MMEKISLRPEHNSGASDHVRIAVIEEALRQQEARTIAALTNRDLARSKAEAAIDHRLASMNEFREQLGTQQLTFLTKEEFNYQHANLRDRLARNTDAITELQTQKTTWTQSWMIVGGLVSALASIGAIITVLLHLPK